MPFRVKDLYDLIRIFEEKPEWRAELRRLVLTDELLTLPELVRSPIEAQARTEERLSGLGETLERLAQTQQRSEVRLTQLAQAQQRTETHLTELAKAQQRTKDAVTILIVDTGDLKGYVLERRYREKAFA